MIKNIIYALELLNKEDSTAEEIKQARKVLIEQGAMRINGRKYELDAKYERFLLETGIKAAGDWVFYGYVTKWD